LGIAVWTEFLWQTRHRETGDVIRQVGSGRQRKVTPEEEENIISCGVCQANHNSARDCGKNLNIKPSHKYIETN
jgi:transposase